jgi:hypothetical protein
MSNDGQSDRAASDDEDSPGIDGASEMRRIIRSELLPWAKDGDRASCTIEEFGAALWRLLDNSKPRCERQCDSSSSIPQTRIVDSCHTQNISVTGAKCR